MGTNGDELTRALSFYGFSPHICDIIKKLKMGNESLSLFGRLFMQEREAKNEFFRQHGA